LCSKIIPLYWKLVGTSSWPYTFCKLCCVSRIKKKIDFTWRVIVYASNYSSFSFLQAMFILFDEKYGAFM